MELIHVDRDIVVCIKPPRVVSTDEPGGLPDLLREALGDPNIRTVHRLDRVVSGLMVLARTRKAASELSRQIMAGEFDKEYLAVLHGIPDEEAGTLRDLLQRNKQERKTYVVSKTGKDVQEAVLNYQLLAKMENLSKVRIELVTGRTHQIRAQFASRNLPLVGDRKYSLYEDDCEIALWSHRIAFNHPYTGKRMEFRKQPPTVYPWTVLDQNADTVL